MKGHGMALFLGKIGLVAIGCWCYSNPSTFGSFAVSLEKRPANH